MSEAMKIGDAFKSAQEATTLASTDRLLAFGQDGSLKKMSRDNVVGNCHVKEWGETAKAWYTVMEASATTAYGGILVLSSGEWCGTPCIHVFAIGGRYTSEGAQMPRITSLLGTTDAIRLRAVKSGGMIRIDALSYSKRTKVFAFGDMTLGDLSKSPTVPSDATVKEYIFTTSVDGGG